MSDTFKKLLLLKVNLWCFSRHFICYIDSTWKFRRGNFDVDSTFKIDEIPIISPRGFFDVVSTSNWRNFCTRFFYCIISQHFLLWEPILSYSGIVLCRCDFNNIDVITDIGTIGTFAILWEFLQRRRSKANSYILQNNTKKDYNVNIYK